MRRAINADESGIDAARAPRQTFSRILNNHLLQNHISGKHGNIDDQRGAVRRELCRLVRENPVPAGPPAHRPSLIDVYERLASERGIDAQHRSAFVLLCARATRGAVVEHMAVAGKRDDISGADLVLGIDAALDILEGIQSRLVRLVECRYFAALNEHETARALGLDAGTLEREWTRARAWTLRILASRDPAGIRAGNLAAIDAAFDDALAIPAEKVDAILERCSPAPGGLRAHVEELITFSAATKPRLEPGDLAVDFLRSILSMDDAARSAAPATAGGWRIVREIRREPLDSLYVVEGGDQPRTVTGLLRFLPASIAPDLETLKTRSDWRVLTSLRHKNIARVLDAATAQDGRVFIVSELVEGRRIDRYCEEESLDVRERLEMFARACVPIQYAHRKLAVHGAIEPANVIVTHDGEVKLLEYGVAPLRRDSVPPGDYSTPESVRGDPLAVASDVYQLGLLLYLLLTGEQAQAAHPRSGKSPEEAICSASPVLPSARVRSPRLRRSLRGDLDAIIMCALRKEPERRYHSVSLLRSDVQRYLRNLPIWARDATPFYRLGKFISRRRLSLAAAALILIVAAAVTGSIP